MFRVNRVSLLVVFVLCVIQYRTYAQEVAKEEWKFNDVVNAVSDGSTSGANNRPISSALSELTKKASGEFDKMCHQLESVLNQLTINEPVKITHLDPNTVNNDCKCYCLCPRDTINSKVVDDIKDKVMDLKTRFINMGKSIKDKIHELTSK